MLVRSKMAIITIIVTFIAAVPVFVQAKTLDSPSIVINLPSRTIELYSGNSLIKEYPVAIGKPVTPTPLGNFSVLSKEKNPAWYPPDKPGTIVLSGPNNPLGYRWMGFISNDYGIHGTNEPKSIGGVVSNGCVRMLEPDVEELFELVGFGTPIKIVYDRTKVSIDDSGRAWLRINPDVYGYGKITVSSIRKQLAKYALNGFVTDGYLNGLVDKFGNSGKSDSQSVEIVRTVQLKVNGNILSERGVIANNSVYIPVKPVADSLKREVFVDGQYVTLDSDSTSGGLKVPATVSDNTVYLSEENMGMLFGGNKSWENDNTCWSFDKTTVYFNHQETSINVIKIDGMAAVPVIKLAEVLNRTGQWDETSQVFYLEDNNDSLPSQTELVLNRDIHLIDSEPFIKITKINEHFNTFVYWNVAGSYIELLYPIPKSNFENPL